MPSFTGGLRTDIVEWMQDASIPLMKRIAGLLTAFFPIAYVAGNAPADITASLIAILFLIHCFHERETEWLKVRWIQIVFLIWVYLLLRSLFSEEITTALGRAGPWIRFPLFAAACAFWLLPEVRVRHLLRSILTITVGFLIFDGLWQYMVGVDLFGREPIPTEEGTLRLTGPFSGPKIGIVLAWLAFPVIAFISRRSHHVKRWHQIPLAACFIMCFLLVVFLSGERMAFLLSVFGMILLALLNQHLRKQILAIGAITAICGAAFVYFNPNLMTRQYYSTLEYISGYQDSPYGMIWQSALEIIEQNPAVGVGPKHFRIVCPRLEIGDMENVEVRCNLHPHQLYLEWLVDGGIIGLLLFIGLIVSIFHYIIPYYKILAGNPVFVGLLVAFILRIWPLSTSISFFVSWSALPFWLVIGWLIALCVAYQRKIQDTN